MDNLLAARWQMALSLGFHIVFAAIGMAMPFLMACAHALWLKTKDPVYRDLTRAWSRGVAIFFATGAVSGTVLAFELGLLWPEFMRHAGAIIGMPFSWEGAAFFVEAIALGIFLYGWKKIPPLWHWLSGLIVGLAGLASAFFVICANAWMNAPAGFDWVNGHAVNIDPWAAMFNDAAFLQGLHMIVAAFAAVGFAVAGVHAWRLLRVPKHPLHRRALVIALAFGATAAILQPLVGDLLTKDVAHRQPLKLAAIESLFETTRRAPVVLGGIPSRQSETISYGVQIPALLSWLATGDRDGEVKGLRDFPRDEWPPLLIVHLAFQIMVGLGMFLAVLGAIFWFFFFRKKQRLYGKVFLRMVALATPLGFIAIETGWVVTEVGRQPWIIYGIMKTQDAVTPMGGLVYELVFVTALYLLLSAAVTWLLIRQIRAVERARA